MILTGTVSYLILAEAATAAIIGSGGHHLIQKHRHYNSNHWWLVTLRGHLATFAVSNKSVEGVSRMLTRPHNRLQVRKRKGDMLNYIVFLRVTPLLPNTFINVCAPIVRVPLPHFALGAALCTHPHHCYLYVVLIPYMCTPSIQQHRDMQRGSSVPFPTGDDVAQFACARPACSEAPENSFAAT